MEKVTQELFKPGHVYFALEDDESGETEILDLTAMDEDKAAMFLEKVLREEAEE